MKFTKEQSEAIETRGENILVSAAAGSGKTRILIERISRLVTEERVSVENMLIVTFTNAAAAEMKTRLRTSLDDIIRKDPKSEEAQFAVEQKGLLQTAQISTFHAFAKNCIQRFFYLIDIEPNYKICDDSQGAILKAEALEQLYEEEFASMSSDFVSFLDKYSAGRNTRSVSSMIEELYTQLSGLPYPWKWLDEKIAQLSVSNEEFGESESYKLLADICLSSVRKSKKYFMASMQMMNAAGLDRLEKNVAKDVAKLDEIEELILSGNLNEAGQLISGFKKEVIRCKADEKESFQAIKDIEKAKRDEGARLIKELGENFFSTSLENQIELVRMTQDDARCLQRLLLSFDEKFVKLKRDKGLLDFNDLEHCCFEILEHEDAARYYRNKFEHIFIDEYQDTNVIQDEIISRIARPNNLFMVGDVKQSIYKFRLAEPSILTNKYEKYKSGLCEDSIVIDLNKNFRSSQSVVDGINTVFDKLMVGYDEDAKLHHGRVTSEYIKKPVVHVLEKAVAISEDSENPVDEELKELKSAELEGIYIADLIKNILAEGEKEGRQIKASDIVILLRSVKTAGAMYYNILKDLGIEAFIDDGDGYFDTIEISVFMNLLSIIDNRQQDIELISVLHSEIFYFTPDELAEIRVGKKYGTFFNVFQEIATGKLEAREELKDKCKYAYDKITEWQQISSTMSLDKFLWFLMIDTGYYLAVGAMPSGKQRQENMRILIDKAALFSDDKSVSLYSFIKYIEAVKRNKVKIPQAKIVAADSNTVNITTIHKSKGLEYPVVIVGGMGRMLQYSKNKQGVSMHKDIGIGLTYHNYEEKWRTNTLPQTLIAYKNLQEEIEEEKRVLYVAMTRAEDQLHMVGSVKNISDYIEKREAEIPSASTFLDMLIGIDFASDLDLKYVDVKNLAENYIETTTIEEVEKIGSSDEILSISEEDKAEIDRILSYKYPRTEDSSIKLKYSVSELNAEISEEKETEESSTVRSKNNQLNLPVNLQKPKFLGKEKTITGAYLGTMFHSIMEHLDFAKLEAEGKPYVEQTVKSLCSRNLVDKENIDKLDLDKFVTFIESDIGRRCAEASRKGNIYKEREFTMATKHPTGQEILVQGIIDCFFVENDKVILLDYKTSYVSQSKRDEDIEEIVEKYKHQLELYANAIESGLGLEVAESYLYLSQIDRAIEVKLK